MPDRTTPPKRIQRKRSKGWRMPRGAVYVGRPSKWGNPFTVEEHGAKLSLDLYRNVVNGLWSPLLLDHLGDQAYVRNYEAMQAMRGRLQNHPKEIAFMELRGRDLVCWCPLFNSHGEYMPCHADVLISIANDIPIEEVVRENTRRSTGEALR